MIEKGEELWLMLINRIISKRNNSANIIIFCTVHDQVGALFICHHEDRVSKYFKVFYKRKKLVLDRGIVLFNLSPLWSGNILRLLVK